MDSRVASPGMIVLCLLTVAHVPVTTFMFCRRAMFPINGHSIPLVLISQTSLFVHNMFQLIPGATGDALPCWLIFSTMWLVFLAVNAFLCRACRIWFFYLLASERVKSNGLECQTKRWFAEHAHWFTERNFVISALGCGTLKFIVSLIPFLAEPNSTQTAGNSTCSSLDSSLMLSQIILAMMLVLVLYVAYRMRNVHDGFSIKTEMKIGVIICFFLVLLSAGRRVMSVEVYTVLWTLGVNGIFFITCTWKIILSTLDSRHFLRVKHHRRGAGDWSHASMKARARAGSEGSAVAMRRHSYECLDYVFGNKRLLQEFTEHLKREFSVENLLFCQTADEFMKDCDCNKFESLTERNTRALAIYLEFIHDDAPSEVNISSNQADAITAVLARCISSFDRTTVTKASLDGGGVESEEPVPATLFSEARKEAYALMESDTFRRFKLHKDRSRPKLIQAFDGV